MKILMVAPGAWIHSQRTLNCLLENGQEVIFVDSVNPYPEGRQGYRFIRYPRTGVRHYSRFISTKLSNQLSLRVAMFQLNLLWRYLKPDVVHVCWLDIRAFQCMGAGLKPLVVSVWGSDVNANLIPGADLEQQQLAGQTLAGADLTIVDAPDMGKKCASLAGREVPTEQLHLGVNTKVFHPDYREAAMKWRRQLGIPPEATVLVSIRALRVIHNHHLILDAFAQVLAHTEAKVFLIFKRYDIWDPTYEVSLRDKAAALGIEKFIRWIEDVPQTRLPEIYALADAIINYPHMDAFPVTLTEAAACRCSVITCRLPSYAGTFAEKYFRMIPPDNAGALADSLIEFISETSAEKNCAAGRLAEAQHYVQMKYDEACYAKRLIEIYEQLSRRPALK